MFAASSTVTVTSYRALIGGQLNVPTTLTGLDKGFSKASSGTAANGPNCGSAVQFGALAGTASPGTTAGHIIYDLQVNTTGSTPTSTCWSVKFTYTDSNGNPVTVGPVIIGTGIVNPPINEVIDCLFDVGTALPQSPFSYSATVT